jgi:MAPEG family
MLDEFPKPPELKGAVSGTALYLSLYVFFQCFQSYNSHVLIAQKRKEAKQASASGKSPETISYREIKYYNNRDFLALWGDRTAGNFREWALIFLPFLWMHALFVDPTQSWMICLVYTSFRALYPIFYRKGILVLASTVPAYVVLIYLFYGLVVEVVMS